MPKTLHDKPNISQINRSVRGFSVKEAVIIERLGQEAVGAVNRNDDVRVFSSLSEALSLFANRHLRGPKRLNSSIADDFRVLSGFTPDQACRELVASGLNLERYSETLGVLSELVRSRSVPSDEITVDAAELLTRLGRTEESERLLLAAHDRHPRDVKVMLALGDMHYHWQEQDENRDYTRAEAWFYKAYELGLATLANEDGRELVEHLGEICIDRMRFEAEEAMVEMLTKTKLGSWRTVADLRDSVWSDGASSRLFRQLSRSLVSDSPLAKDRDDRLRKLFRLYEHLPQESLGGYSVFERSELMPPGRQEMRIMSEVTEAYVASTGSGQVSSSLLLSDDFFRFQRSYMDGIDPSNGRRRSAVVSEERAETRRRHEESEHPWLGFLKYRKGQ